jgi:hypothetical protein
LLDAALILLRLDLDPLHPFLAALYAPTPRGRPPCDPVAVLRALLLFTLLRSECSEARRKQRLQTHDSLTHHLNAELTAQAAQPRPRELQQRLEDLLFQLAVLPSAQRGLLGDLQQLVVCGDGASLVTGASPTGRAACHCRQQGLYKCDCARFYADATADWGWDSYREVYYFGHTYYQHVVSSHGHDLPVHVTLGPASESDFTLSLKSLDRFQKTLREHEVPWQLRTVVYDSGHDSLARISQHGFKLTVRQRVFRRARAGWRASSQR